MAFSNNLKKQVDLPVWEWLRFFPAANSAISEMAGIETADNRYMYMLVSSTFFRYDTYSDVWTSLAPPPTAPLLILSLKYLPFGGYAGMVISATSTTITGPFLQGKSLIGKTIRIISGTGNGQERTITGHADAVIADSGIPTTATASAITDTTKKWDINQWTGYQVKIVDFNGQSQYRKILYNSATVLTVADASWAPYTPSSENAAFATAPTTASIYTIESNVITTSAWTTTPDGSSKFKVLSGVIACLSTTASAPFQTFQIYDIASDIWYTQSCQQGVQLVAGAVANDISFVRLGEGETGTFDSGTATVSGSSTRALGDASKTWTVDQWANYEVKITGGTNAGAIRRILANTASILYVDGAFANPPDATSTYVIRPFRSTILTSGCALASMLRYDTDLDMWTQGFASDGGVTSAMAIKSADTVSIGCTAARATTGIKTINPVPTAGGSGYIVGDVLTCNQTGSGGLLIVTSTDNNGVVTGLKLQKAGTGYGIAAGRSTTGGTGTLCTFEITAVDTIGTITTLINHNYQAGDSIIFGGASDATWNTTYTIIGTSGLTTLDVVITAAGSAVAAQAQTTAIIVDGSKNWTVNEHAGKIVQLSLTGYTGTSLMRKITSNTANTITIYGSVLGAAAVDGTGRYAIYDQDALGRAVQEKNPTRTNTGWATGGSPTTLVDNNKSWRGNQWLGYKVKVISGMGFDKGESVITSNTYNTLTVSGGYGFTPDATTKYIIQDTFGVPTTVTNTTNAVVTDTAKNWVVNQWSGFKLRINAGEGAGQEIVITNNTATALTCTGVFGTAPVANSSVYTILGVPVRGTGHELTWASNTTVNAGRYVISPRGGASNLFDRYNISTNTWDLTFAPKPDTEVFGLGSMYAYDGQDRIYIQKDTTGRIFYMDLNTYSIHGAGQCPYVIGTTGIGTVVNGNRMEICQTADGLRYLYLMKHTGAALSATGGGTEMFRQLIPY